MEACFVSSAYKGHFESVSSLKVSNFSVWFLPPILGKDRDGKQLIPTPPHPTPAKYLLFICLFIGICFFDVCAEMGESFEMALFVGRKRLNNSSFIL